MLRVAVMVGALAAFFSAAVFFGGDAVGAWDEPRIAPDTPERPFDPKKAGDEPPSKRERGSERRERRVAKAEARYAARVDGLCLRAAREVAALAPPTTAAEAKSYLLRVERLNARLNDRFAAIEPPPTRARDARRIVSLLDREERLVRQLVVAATAGDAARTPRIAGALQELAGLESALLVALGAKRCDTGLSAASTTQA